MNQNNVTIAKAFYTAMREQKFEEMGKYLHPHIQFCAPLDKIEGKEAYLEAAKNFTALFKTLAIRATFGEGNQAMLVYDLDFPAPIGNFSSAALMTLCDGLIKKIELFYDARPFEKKKDETFS